MCKNLLWSQASTVAVTGCFKLQQEKTKSLTEQIYLTIKIMITVNWYALNSTQNDIIMKPI